MSEQHPTVDEPGLGTFTRAQTALSDGTVLTHDWYVGTLARDDGPLELMIEATDPDDARRLILHVHTVIADLDHLRRIASDAVVTAFSQGEPEPAELDEAAADLTLETIEVQAGGDVVLHLVDTCENHFPEGYWPAVHLDAHGGVTQVTVES